MNKLADSQEPIEEESDEVVGVAFRWSLIVILCAALVGTATWFFWPREKDVEIIKPKETDEIHGLDRTSVALPDFAFRRLGPAEGIDFVHFSGARGKRLLPETMGGGVALFDFDNDGTLDILFVSGTHWPADPPAENAGSSLRLYSNDGQAHFTDVTEASGLVTQLHGMGCAVGDYDNDGWNDLFITCVGRNRFFRNNSGLFEEVTDKAGVAGASDAWSTAAGFFDFDHDGQLDLMVCNYVHWTPEIDFELNFTLNGVDRAYGPPTQYQGVHPYLYRNLGDGTFAEVAAAAGLQVVNAERQVPVAKALGLLLVDLNEDGWDDVVVANDTVRNLMFINRQDGTFEETGVLSGIAYDRTGRATGAMGIDIGNIWNDNSLGIAIGNFANEMTSVFVSGPDGSGFVDEAAALGIGAPTRQRLTFGTLWEDFDLDGRLDLLQVNGHLEDSIETVQPSQTYRQPAQIFWNKGLVSGTCFAEVPAKKLGDLAEPIVGRGAATGDLDRDGDPDLVLTQIDGAPLVLINEQRTGNKHLRIDMAGTGYRRLGYGARIEAKLGSNTIIRNRVTTRSYLSQSCDAVTLGLGPDGESIDTLKVLWQDGSRYDSPAQVPSGELLLK